MSPIGIIHLAANTAAFSVICLIAANFVMAWLAWMTPRSWLARRLKTGISQWYREPASLGRGTSVGLGPEERVAWSATAVNPLLILLGLLSAVAIGWQTDAMPIANRALSLAGAVVWFAMIAGQFFVRVNVSASGLDVVSRPSWVSRRHVQLSDIDGADVVVVNPLTFGGWGRHPVPSQLCMGYVIRGGSALSVQLKSGQRIVVTVNGAQDAAGLLNMLVFRQEQRAESR